LYILEIYLNYIFALADKLTDKARNLKTHRLTFAPMARISFRDLATAADDTTE